MEIQKNMRALQRMMYEVNRPKISSIPNFDLSPPERGNAKNSTTSDPKVVKIDKRIPVASINNDNSKVVMTSHSKKKKSTKKRRRSISVDIGTINPPLNELSDSDGEKSGHNPKSSGSIGGKGAYKSKYASRRRSSKKKDSTNGFDELISHYHPTDKSKDIPKN